MDCNINQNFLHQRKQMVFTFFGCLVKEKNKYKVAGCFCCIRKKHQNICSGCHLLVYFLQYTVYDIAGFRNSLRRAGSFKNNFQVTYKFLNVANSTLKGLSERIFRLINVFIEASKYFIVYFIFFTKKQKKKFININFDVLDLYTNIQIQTQSLSISLLNG